MLNLIDKLLYRSKLKTARTLFSHVSAAQSLWFRLRYVDSYWMDYHEIWFRQSWSLEDEL